MLEILEFVCGDALVYWRTLGLLLVAGVALAMVFATFSRIRLFEVKIGTDDDITDFDNVATGRAAVAQPPGRGDAAGTNREGKK